MSTFYKENNFESSQNLYDKRTIYKGELLELSERYSCLVDFNFAEKCLYGKVSRSYVSIEPNETLSKFTRIRNIDGSVSRVRVFSFVADAFADLTRQFEKSVQIGKIRKTAPYLSTLKAFDGYQKTNVAYTNYFNTLISAMQKVKEQKSVKIINFSDFINFLEDFSMSVGKSFPVTKTGFIRSRFNSILNNGISIEISDLTYNNDDQKVTEFVNSPNFEYYLNACNSFGFMVDIDAPWRIIADIASGPMINYASRYGYNSTDVVLTTAYKTVHNSYFNNISEQLLNIYNALAAKFIDTDDCTGRAIIIRPTEYTLEQINNLYNEKYLIKLYCTLRFLEEESQYSKAVSDQIITDTVNLSSSRNLSFALGYFERFVSQPFDYRGSLSYLIREQEKREDI